MRVSSSKFFIGTLQTEVDKYDFLDLHYRVSIPYRYATNFSAPGFSRDGLSVSIPYGYAANIPSSAFLSLICSEFQFLIGTLQTRLGALGVASHTPFHSL